MINLRKRTNYVSKNVYNLQIGGITLMGIQKMTTLQIFLWKLLGCKYFVTEDYYQVTTIVKKTEK